MSKSFASLHFIGGKTFLNRVGIVMLKFSCNMLPDPIAKLYLNNKDYHSHNTRNKNNLSSCCNKEFYLL